MSELNQPPIGGAILRFAEPFDRQAIANRLSPDAEPATEGGKSFYRATRPFATSLYYPDDRTLVLGPEPLLREMIGAPTDAESPLLDRLRKLDPRTLASAVVILEPLRDQIAAALDGAPVPPPFQPFTEIPRLLNAVELHPSFAPGSATKIVLEGRDEKSAARLDELLGQAMTLTTQMVDAQLAQQAQAAEPTQQAMTQYVKRMLKLAFDSIERRQEGSALVLSVQGNAIGAPATIGTLTALLLPAVQSAREAARRVQTSNNLKQIMLAMHSYHDVNRRFPPAASRDKQGGMRLSWRVYLLPYLEQQALYDKFHLDEPWDSEHNKQLIAEMPEVYRNPNLALTETTNFLVPVGEATLFHDEKGTRLADVLDGTSNTIAVVEADEDRAVVWTAPDDLEYDPEQPSAGLGGLRPGGFNVALADGSVRFIQSTLAPDVLRALFTRAGGEIVRDF